jgi:hypothetical protein
MFHYVVLIIIVIIIITYFISSWSSTANDDYLYGHWMIENDEFCDTAEIDSMMLFIGEPLDSSSHVIRQSYLIVMPDMANQGMKLTYTRGWAAPWSTNYSVNAEVKFDDEQIWDENINISVDIMTGKMIIRSGDTIYAKLYKQHDITEMVRATTDDEPSE